MAAWLTLCGLILAGYALERWRIFYQTTAKLKYIPTVGGDGFIMSYLSAWKNVFWMHKAVQQGYQKYPGSIFKIPTLLTPTGWWVLVSGAELTEDIRRAGPEHISFPEFVRDLMQADLLFPIDLFSQPYHADVVRISLTRGFGACLPDIANEIEYSLRSRIPPSTEWINYALHKTVVHVVCQAANRLFVGLPLCRDQGFLELNKKMAMSSMVMASLLQVLPLSVRGIAAKLFAIGPRTHRAMLGYVGPLVEERLAMYKAGELEWERKKPNDLITWIIEAAPPSCRNVNDIVQRMIFINFVSVHTTSMTTTNALFDLAARQEYIPMLRREASKIIATHGWTKEAVGKMVKLDSFLKESSRLLGVGAASITRKVMKDFPLSNGVVLPAGCSIGVASYSLHRNPDIYNDPDRFDGSRFLTPAENVTEGNDRLKNQFTSLNLNYLLFGHGRHACPGRFFAAAEIKAVIALILLNYDIRLDGDATEAPPGKWFSGQYVPDDKAQLLFRSRLK